MLLAGSHSFTSGPSMLACLGPQKKNSLHPTPSFLSKQRAPKHSDTAPVTLVKSQHSTGGHFFTLQMSSLHGERTFAVSLLALAGWRRHSHTSKSYNLEQSGTNSYFTFLYLALCLIHMLQAKISAPQLVSSGACAPFMHCLRQQIENVSSYTLHWRHFCFLLIS